MELPKLSRSPLQALRPLRPLRRAEPDLARSSIRWLLAAAVVTSLAGAPQASRPSTKAEGLQEQAPARHEHRVSARKYAFIPERIEVSEGDVVKITLQAEDIPHSFTIDAYRIAKRANPGRIVVFEFRANQSGTFPFYCNLSVDEGCRQMRGELVVHAR